MTELDAVKAAIAERARLRGVALGIIARDGRCSVRELSDTAKISIDTAANLLSAMQRDKLLRSELVEKPHRRRFYMIVPQIVPPVRPASNGKGPRHWTKCRRCGCPYSDHAGEERACPGDVGTTFRRLEYVRGRAATSFTASEVNVLAEIVNGTLRGADLSALVRKNPSEIAGLLRKAQRMSASIATRKGNGHA